MKKNMVTLALGVLFSSAAFAGTQTGTNAVATGTNAVAIGDGAFAFGSNAIAIGQNAKATTAAEESASGPLAKDESSAKLYGTQGGITIGTESLSGNNFGITVGNQNTNYSVNGVMFGNQNKIENGDNFVVTNGNKNQSVGNNIVTTGNENNISGNNAVTFGNKNKVSDNSENNALVGNENTVTKTHNAKVIGNKNTVTGANDSNVVGNNNTIKSANVVALGNNITVDENQGDSVVLGDGSAAEQGAVSVGSTAKKRKVVNVAAGNLAADSAEATTGGQLFEVKTELQTSITQNANNITTNANNITQNTNNITQNTNSIVRNTNDIARNTNAIATLNLANDQIMQNKTDIASLNSRLSHHVNRLDTRITHLDKTMRRGVASAAAMGMLPQSALPGKSMFGAAVTNYKGEQALAVGYSRLSDNGKHVIKLSGSSNVMGHHKDVLSGVAYGYQW